MKIEKVKGESNESYICISGTGTSLQVAKDIGQEFENVEIISIPKLMKEESWEISGDNVGFVFPCYYGAAPQLIRQFINEASNVDIKYAYGIVTAGGVIGYSLVRLKEYLDMRAVELSYGRSIIISSNYMNGWYYNMIFKNPEKIQKNIDIATIKCKEVSIAVKNNEKDIEKPKYINYIIPRLISPKKYYKDTRSWDSEFSVTVVAYYYLCLFKYSRIASTTNL